MKKSIFIIFILFVLMCPNIIYGYEGKEASFDIASIGIIIFSIISTLFVGFLWKTYGKDDEVKEIAGKYPPKEYNPLETAWSYFGETNEEMVASLVLHLANKGYIEIKDNGVYDTKIIKVKEYDGDNELEKTFFDGLFECRKSKENDYVEISELKNKFYLTYETIKEKMNLNSGKFYENNTKEKGIWSIVLSVIIIVLVLSKLLFDNIGASEFRITGVNTITIVVGLICVVILLLFTIIMPKRTKYGLEVLGRIKGFTSFIENAKREDLEELLKSDPDYFYNVLPYAYALGISGKYILNFEKLVTEMPGWYRAKNMSLSNFNSFMKYTMQTISVSISKVSQGEDNSLNNNTYKKTSI